MDTNNQPPGVGIESNECGGKMDIPKEPTFPGGGSAGQIARVTLVSAEVSQSTQVDDWGNPIPPPSTETAAPKSDDWGNPIPPPSTETAAPKSDDWGNPIPPPSTETVAPKTDDWGNPIPPPSTETVAPMTDDWGNPIPPPNLSNGQPESWESTVIPTDNVNAGSDNWNESQPQVAEGTATQSHLSEAPPANGNWGDPDNQEADNGNKYVKDAPNPNEIGANDAPMISTSQDRVELKFQQGLAVPAFGLLDGVPFTTPDYVTLENIDGVKGASVWLDIWASEPSLGSRIVITSTAYMKADPGYKPKAWTMYISISAADIDKDSFKVTELDVAKLPKGLVLPEGYDASEKAVVEFETRRTLPLSKKPIPTMLVEEAGNMLKKLYDQVQDAKVNNKKMTFTFVISWYRETKPPFLNKLIPAVHRENDSSPYTEWSKDSPHMYHLQIGNLKQPGEQPAFTEPNFIAAALHQYSSRLESNVYTVYSLQAETNYARGYQAEISAATFDAFLVGVPGTNKKKATAPLDNDKYKVVNVFAPWNESAFEILPAGTSVRVELPFPVPECPEYKGDRVQLIRAPEFADTFDEHSDRPHGPTVEEKKRKWEETRKEDLLRRQGSWSGVVVKHSPICPFGWIHIQIHRSPYLLWTGPKEEAPSVDTVLNLIPPPKSSDPQDFVRLLQSELKTGQPTRLHIEPAYSEQTWKDLVAGVHLFHTKPLDESHVDPSQHLCKALVGMDDDLPLPPQDLLAEMPDDAIDSVFGICSAEQKKSVGGFNKVEHAMVAVIGPFGSGKTFVAELACLGMLKKNRNNRLLWTIMMNDGVNREVARLAAAAKSLGMDDLNIVRLHNMDFETKSYTKATNNKDTWFSNIDEDVRFDIETDTIRHILLSQAVDVEASAKKGDRRFDASIREYSLHEAMKRHYDAHVDTNETYQRIGTALRTWSRSPNDPHLNLKTLKADIKQLAHDALRAAHIVCTTTALAARPAIASVIGPGIVNVVIDETGKTPMAYVQTIIALYNFRTLFTPGDDNQMCPWWKTDTNPEFVSVFGKTGSVSLLDRLKRAGWKVFHLNETFRIWDHDFVDFISTEFYEGKVIDGNLGKAPPKESTFFRNYIAKRYGVRKGAVVFIITKNSRSRKDAGNRSWQNEGHQIVVRDVVKELLAAVDADTTLSDEEKKAFTVSCLTTYKAQWSGTSEKVGLLNDPRLSCLTGTASQSAEDSVSVLDLTNVGMLSGFQEDTRGLLLVELTRWKYGAVVIMDESAFKLDRYKERQGPKFNIASFAQKFPHLHALNQYSIIQGIRCELEVDPEGPCRICGTTGHKARDCPKKPVKVKVCKECGSADHIVKDCPVKKKSKGAVLDETYKCQKCGVYGQHLARDCKAAYCGHCKVRDYDHRDCPSAQCSKCPGERHWTKNCPKVERCWKCGASHSADYCPAVPSVSRAALSGNLVFDVVVEAEPSQPSQTPPQSATRTLPQNAVGEKRQVPEVGGAFAEGDVQLAIEMSLATAKDEDEYRTLEAKVGAFMRLGHLKYEDRMSLQAILLSCQDMMNNENAISEDNDEQSQLSLSLRLTAECWKTFMLNADQWLISRFGAEYDKFSLDDEALRNASLVESKQYVPAVKYKPEDLPSGVDLISVSLNPEQTFSDLSAYELICSHPPQHQEYPPNHGDEAVIWTMNNMAYRAWAWKNESGETVYSWYGIAGHDAIPERVQHAIVDHRLHNVPLADHLMLFRLRVDETKLVPSKAIFDKANKFMLLKADTAFPFDSWRDGYYDASEEQTKYHLNGRARLNLAGKYSQMFIVRRYSREVTFHAVRQSLRQLRRQRNGPKTALSKPIAKKCDDNFMHIVLTALKEAEDASDKLSTTPEELDLENRTVEEVDGGSHNSEEADPESAAFEETCDNGCAGITSLTPNEPENDASIPFQEPGSDKVALEEVGEANGDTSLEQSAAPSTGDIDEANGDTSLQQSAAPSTGKIDE